MKNTWALLNTLWLLGLSFASQAWTVRYQHTDLQGSVIAESNAQGSIQQRYDYKPYGEGTPSQKSGLGYTGHLEDPELWLTYMQQRFYDPVIGRFYSNDPVGFTTQTPVTFSRYAYANNNPYKFTDPYGRASWPVAKNSKGQIVVTSGFGPRNTGIKGASVVHNGIDIRAPKGTKIRATQNGKVIEIGNNKGGNFIRISNADGSLSSHGHTQASEGINVGDEVKEGNEIGESDGSGTNEPHQHYTYRPGTVEAPATTDTTPVDPITTQFEDKPDSEVCEKGSKSC